MYFYFRCFCHTFAIANQLPGFSISRLANVEDFFNVYIYIKGYIYLKVISNVNIYVSINDYSFKYICLACYLKLRFYCLTCSAMSNLTSPDFTTTRQSSEILILKIETLEFQDKKNIEIIEF